MEAYIDTLCFLNQKENNNQFKNKNPPELPENRTVRKSDNQGLKEETSIQTRLVGGVEMGSQGGEDTRQSYWLGTGGGG